MVTKASAMKLMFSIKPLRRSCVLARSIIARGFSPTNGAKGYSKWLPPVLEGPKIAEASLRLGAYPQFSLTTPCALYRGES